MTERDPAPRRTPRPIRLQARDLDLLHSLSVGRFLTVPAIEWLHYPTWRERYKAFVAQQADAPEAVFYPNPNLYRRLTALREGSGALVRRYVRSTERGTVVYHRLPDAYALTERGAELLCRQRALTMEQLWYEDGRKKSVKNLEHSIAIGSFYAALRAALEHSGQQLADWQGDHLLVRDYDRIRAPGVREPLPILPDATFTLAGQRCFVEIDMGTTNLRSWGEKVRAYEAYAHSAALAARYATDDFVVLVVAPTEQRRLRIAEEVLKATRQVPMRYRFLTEDRVHPTTIRPAWRMIETFAVERRRVVDRLVELPTSITFTAAALWSTLQ